MKRITRLLVAIMAVAAVGTGVALAATSPTVATRAALGVTDTTALLRAFVDPGGNQTGYVFQYGPTTALGLTTASHSAGHGAKPVKVAVIVRGLSPGTTYFFRVAALNAAGGATGAIRSFKTTGNPLATVATGPAVSVGKYEATPTGSVDPQGAATSWRIQYGFTTGYGLETFPLPLAAVSTSLPVSVMIPGLAPGKLFHYRVVANNSAGDSAGADQTFFTFPAFRRTPKMRTRTSPSPLTHAPFTFTTSGSLFDAANFVPASLRCSGQVGVRAFSGSRQVAFVIAQVDPNCAFSTPLPIGHRIGGGATALQVKISFRGNGYLKPVQRTDHVTLG